MMILEIVGVAIIAAVLILLIKEERPELAFLLSLITGLIILILVIDQVGVVINLIQRLAEKAEIDQIYFLTIMKIVGIAYIGEFGAEIIRDIGEKALASKVEMTAKILIMIIAVPIMLSLIETVIRLIP